LRERKEKKSAIGYGRGPLSEKVKSRDKNFRRRKEEKEA